MDCQNQFRTCYLILDFRPTYFSYFQKITAISHAHNVKKEVVPKDPFPVVKGLISLQKTLTSSKNSTLEISRINILSHRIFIYQILKKIVTCSRSSDTVSHTVNCALAKNVHIFLKSENWQIGSILSNQLVNFCIKRVLILSSKFRTIWSDGR